MAWKKVLLEGDAAELGTDDPEDVGTVASPGSGITAPKIDHVHKLGADCIDSGDKIADDVVDNEHIADDAVKAAQIDAAATDIELAQVILTPVGSGTGTTVGTIAYLSGDDHPYVYVT